MPVNLVAGAVSARDVTQAVRRRWRAWPAVLALVAVFVAACAGPATAPTNPPTPDPTPTPLAGPTVDQLVAACGGKAVPGADAYGGDMHPLVVVEGGAISSEDYVMNLDYVQGNLPSPIQLVICVDRNKFQKVKDCGTVMRTWSFLAGGAGGTISTREGLVLWQDTQPVRVVLAKTGKTLSKQTLLGERLTCANSTYLKGEMGNDYVYGTTVHDDGKVELFAYSVSVKPVPSPTPVPSATPVRSPTPSAKKK
jgi:hypothetical protein